MSIKWRILFFSLIALTVTASATGDQILTHYRGSDGKVTHQSKANAQIMHHIARDQGHVTLWLTLNYPFNFYFDELTPEEIAAQELAVAEGFDELLDPHVQDGDVWHRSAGPFIMGPGIAVRATGKGLKNLLKDDRLLQIVAIEDVPN